MLSQLISLSNINPQNLWGMYYHFYIFGIQFFIVIPHKMWELANIIS
jgi:hypothetical protein